MIISKDELNKLIKELAGEEKIFLCEAQFQFELAWELRKYFELQEKSDYRVYLEYPSRDEKRKYYDIVIKSGNTFCVIELKYKTKYQKNVCYDGVYVELKNHAAQDLGRYDFLKDISRIEDFEKDNNGKSLDCGYAIFLTNDSAYWDKDGKGYIYEDFALNEGRTIPSDRNLKWIDGTKSTSVGVNRLNRLKLKSSYQLNWKFYNEQFKCLILEIK